MKASIKIAIAIISCFMAGCASTVSIHALSQPTNKNDEVYIHKFRYNDPEKEATSIGLEEGVYKIEYENKEGYFYRGRGLPVKIPGILNHNQIDYPDNMLPGGLFISKSRDIDKSKWARIYYYELNLPSSTHIDIPSYFLAGLTGADFNEILIKRGVVRIVITPGISTMDILSHIAKK